MEIKARIRKVLDEYQKEYDELIFRSQNCMDRETLLAMTNRAALIKRFIHSWKIWQRLSQ